MYGSHLSIAGGLYRAAEAAEALGIQALQIFTRNQQQWQSPALTDDQVRLWQSQVNASGIQVTVSHDSYLINLASPDTGLRDKSVALMIDELQRCEALSIPYLVAHPGAHKGEGESAGLARVASSLDAVHRATSGFKTICCLENTAGQGTGLGYRFEHLRQIMDQVAAPERLGLCLDTAHAFEAGYPLTGRAGAMALLDEVDGLFGPAAIRVIHLNDSKTPLGSRVDRHAHIGHGCMGKSALKVFAKSGRFASVPQILETPKQKTEDGRLWDAVNLQTLRSL